jgi:hypothetical protein
MATAVMPLDVLVPSGTMSTQSANAPGEILPPQEQNSISVPITLMPSGKDTALPSHFLFGALRHPALMLRKPMPLRTERSKGGISVIWEEGNEFGFGQTFGDAIEDFAATMGELYCELSDDDVLGADLVALRDRLSHYIDVRKQ